MNRKVFSSAIKKTAFKYLTSKKIALLMLQGMDRNEVYHKCFDENYNEVDSEQRRREITNVVYERLAELDKYLLGQFISGDVDTSKVILVYAIAKADSLFFDFLYEVYREALLTERDYITLEDYEVFFASKKQTDSIVSQWSDKTIEDLSCGYRNILADSGLGIRSKRSIVAKRVFIHPDVEEYIKQIGDMEYLKAILGA